MGTRRAKVLKSTSKSRELLTVSKHDVGTNEIRNRDLGTVF